jgi:hypothetical protein
MAQTAKNQKFEMLFDWFDQNDDGSLTEDDFIAMASLFTELTHPDDRPNKDALRAAFARWWRILLEAAGRSSPGDAGSAGSDIAGDLLSAGLSLPRPGR